MYCRFRHTCLRVKDLDRSIAFYCKHLGFVEGPAFLNAQGKKDGVFLYLNAGVFLELFIGDPGAFTGHLCFEVANVRESVTALRAQGVKVTDPCLGRSKAWMAFFQDPDGVSIELNEFSPPESWIARFLEERDPAQK